MSWCTKNPCGTYCFSCSSFRRNFKFFCQNTSFL